MIFQHHTRRDFFRDLSYFATQGGGPAGEKCGPEKHRVQKMWLEPDRTPHDPQYGEKQ